MTMYRVYESINGKASVIASFASQSEALSFKALCMYSATSESMEYWVESIEL